MKKILIIEDDESLRLEISTILKFEGFDMLEANNGLTGLKLAISSLPDLILCDIMMPEMNGIQVLEGLKATESTRLIPFIFLTALAERTNLRLGMESGANDYITKPFTRIELLNAISAQLSNSKNITDCLESELHMFREKIISKIPHELNTPLHGILGFSNILEESSFNLRKDEVKEMAGYITRSGKRLQILVERYDYFIRLLAIKNTRMDTTKRCSSPELFMSTMLASIATDYKRPDDIEFSLADADINISDDEFITLFRELIDNAFKFSTPNDKIYVKSVNKGNSYFITIKDSGRGISVENIKKVGAFQQFEREMYEQQGSGLGLAISKLLAELNGGTMNISSEIGKGTTIIVKLPSV